MTREEWSRTVRRFSLNPKYREGCPSHMEWVFYRGNRMFLLNFGTRTVRCEYRRQRA